MSRRDMPAEANESTRRDAGLRRCGLLVGLAVAVVGTILNMGLGHDTAGRVLVILGALLALLAHGRPQWLRVVDRR